MIKRLGILPPWLTYGTGNSLLTWFAVFGGGSLDPSDPKKLNVLQPADVTTMTWMKQYADHFGGYDSITNFIQSWGPSLIYKGYVSAFVNGQVAMSRWSPPTTRVCSTRRGAAPTTASSPLP